MGWKAERGKLGVVLGGIILRLEGARGAGKEGCPGCGGFPGV